MKPQRKTLAALALSAGFLLGIKDGYIALWKDPDPQPYRIFQIRADTLPPADQLLLQRGIRADSPQQLWMLLEDYL